MMNRNDKQDALATIREALYTEAAETLTMDFPMARISRERMIGQRLQQIGAGMVALDTVAKALR